MGENTEGMIKAAELGDEQNVQTSGRTCNNSSKTENMTEVNLEEGQGPREQWLSVLGCASIV